jgi:hypothetical protein
MSSILVNATQRHYFRGPSTFGRQACFVDFSKNLASCCHDRCVQLLLCGSVTKSAFLWYKARPNEPRRIKALVAAVVLFNLVEAILGFIVSSLALRCYTFSSESEQDIMSWSMDAPLTAGQLYTLPVSFIIAPIPTAIVSLLTQSFLARRSWLVRPSLRSLKDSGLNAYTDGPAFKTVWGRHQYLYRCQLSGWCGSSRFRL